MQKIIFVQYSDNLLTTDKRMRNYYQQNYAAMPGYHFPPHFFEIPYWIPMLSGMLTPNMYQKELFISKDADDIIERAMTEDQRTVFSFSVMDANVHHVLDFCTRIKRNKIILGGYVAPHLFDTFQNAHYFTNIRGVSKELHTRQTVDYAMDYSMFEGMRCIPRLTLSTGCNFKCLFCTDVPLRVEAVDPVSIRNSTNALKPLDFSLIYIDDKSYGQASNYPFIRNVKEEVLKYNKNFLGFIAQTSPVIAAKNGFLAEVKSFGLKYLEIGMETGNESLLKKLNKPFRIKHLDATAEKCRALGIGLIPNIIVGIPEDSYKETINWVYNNRDIIKVININYLSVHNNAIRGAPLVISQSREDADQNSLNKSWLSAADITRATEAVDVLYNITSAKENKLIRTNEYHGRRSSEKPSPDK